MNYENSLILFNKFPGCFYILKILNKPSNYQMYSWRLFQELLRGFFVLCTTYWKSRIKKIINLTNKYRLLDVTPIPRNHKSCCFKSLMLDWSNKSESKFCCNKPIRWGFTHNGNYYSSGINAASVSKIINQRSYCWVCF